jgi:hypothetical protein
MFPNVKARKNINIYLMADQILYWCKVVRMYAMFISFFIYIIYCNICYSTWKNLGIFLFTTASRMTLGPTQLPTQWVSGALSLGIKRPGRDADHSPPSSAEVKEWVELYIHSPNMPSWHGAQLKHRDNFTFTLHGKIKQVNNTVGLSNKWKDWQTSTV